MTSSVHEISSSIKIIMLPNIPFCVVLPSPVKSIPLHQFTNQQIIRHLLYRSPPYWIRTATLGEGRCGNDGRPLHVSSSTFFSNRLFWFVVDFWRLQSYSLSTTRPLLPSRQHGGKFDGQHAFSCVLTQSFNPSSWIWFLLIILNSLCCLRVKNALVASSHKKDFWFVG